MTGKISASSSLINQNLFRWGYSGSKLPSDSTSQTTKMDERCKAPTDEIVRQVCAVQSEKKANNLEVATIKTYYGLLKELREKEPESTNIRTRLRDQIRAVNKQNPGTYDASLRSLATNAADIEPTKTGAAFKTFFSYVGSFLGSSYAPSYTLPYASLYNAEVEYYQRKDVIEAEEADAIKIADLAVDTRLDSFLDGKGTNIVVDFNDKFNTNSVTYFYYTTGV